jgi:predicted acylesterase/phospholipase RssA
MKGGITSGVVYPWALTELGATYRLRGVGGASAGAIGAAAGAAAEYGRAAGGFQKLKGLPQQLGDGRLRSLFQPQPRTRPLLRLMLAATAHSSSSMSRYAALLAALVGAFPLATAVGVLPGLVLVVYGATVGGAAGVVLVVVGVVVLLAGWVVAMLLRLLRKLTVDVPGNLFGICRGLGADPGHPGFTDWLADVVDDIAGLPAESRPLKFGHLWSGGAEVAYVDPGDRAIDLRMVSTCLSQGRPYELPWEARNFFYEPGSWDTLFPSVVMEALRTAPPATPPPGEGEGVDQWQWEDDLAARHTPPLRRLPAPEHLPVIVATRLSLSFPLLISAVPLWTIDRRSQKSADATKAFRQAVKDQTDPPTSGVVFAKLWFTDGGLCSNFPVHLFDAALASRPTFAINLGSFPPGKQPSTDQRENLEYATNNRSGLLPSYSRLPERGLAAIVGFASAAVNTARNWQDNSQIDQPGFRDRIVRVLQTPLEGGMNLDMPGPTIDGLAARGRAAGQVMVEQFNTPHYPADHPVATGWDNHRWVRYRALMSCLPTWLASYARGRKVLDIDPANPPSYRLDPGARELAAEVAAALDHAAAVLAAADQATLTDLTDAPRPQGIIRRIPQI